MVVADTPLMIVCVSLMAIGVAVGIAGGRKNPGSAYVCGVLIGAALALALLHIVEIMPK